jgi:hypothetical protein
MSKWKTPVDVVRGSLREGPKTYADLLGVLREHFPPIPGYDDRRGILRCAINVLKGSGEVVLCGKQYHKVGKTFGERQR